MMAVRRRQTADPEGAGPTYDYRYPRPPESDAAGIPSALVFLAGVWLILAPFGFDYRNTGGDFGPYWNDIVIGAAVAVLAGVRLVTGLSTAPLSLVNVVLGGWLIISPWVLDYRDGADAPTATWNDVATGSAIVILALVSWGVGSVRRTGQ